MMKFLTSIINSLTGVSGTKGFLTAWSCFAYKDGKWLISIDYQQSLEKEKGGTSAIRIFVDNEGNLRFSMDDILDWVAKIHYRENRNEWLNMLTRYFVHDMNTQYIPITPHSDKLDLSKFNGNFDQLMIPQ